MSKKIKVLYGSTVKYTVSAPYYVTKTGTINSVTENTSEEVTLARVTDKFMVTLSVDPTGAGSITGAESGQYLAGTTLVLTHTDTVGYTFDGWYVNGEKKWTDNPYNFVVDQESTIVAKYNRDTVYYQITVNAEPQNAGNPTGEGQYEEGTTATLSSNSAEGYRFSQWQDGNTSDPREVLVTSDKTYTANYVKTYTITKDPSMVNGTIEITPENNTYDAGAEVSIEAIPSNHYHFVSWTGTISGDVNPYSLIVNRDHTIGAVFTEDAKYNVQVSTSGNGTAIIEGGYSSKSYYSGEYCTVIATANTGYHFVSWTSGSTVVSNNASYNFEVTTDITLTANFAEDTVYHNISVSPNNPNYGTVNGGGSKAEGSNITVTATANNGYAFVNWTENGNIVSTNASYSFTVTGDRTLIANFTQNAFTINVSANPTAGGTVTGGGAHEHGQSCTVTATANNGYTFVNWTENGSQVSTNASYSFTVDSNRTLVANFQQNLYTLTVSSNDPNKGTVSKNPDKQNYYYNDSVTITATPTDSDRYEFSQWNDGNTQNPRIIQITNSVEYIAIFNDKTIPSYTITASANPLTGGSVSGYGTYNSGATCELTAAANTGYTFVNWTESGSQVSTNASYSFTVDSNRTLVANFNAKNIEIDVTVDPENTGVIDGTGIYHQGDQCTLTAYANTGYEFAGWFNLDTEEQISSNNPYVFIVDEEELISIVAKFNKKHYNINTSVNPANSGTVDGGGNKEYGSSCTVRATANNGYTFDNWTENGSQVSTNANYTFTVENARTLVANFSKKTYNINTSIVGADGDQSIWILANPNPVEHGSYTTISGSLGSSSYTLNKLEENGTQVSSYEIVGGDYQYTAYNVTNNMTFVAYYIPQTVSHNVYTSVNPNEAGTITGAGQYNTGATVTITTTANPGYVFDHWEYPSGLTIITAGSGGGNGTAGGSGTGTGNTEPGPTNDIDGGNTSTTGGDGTGSGTSSGTGSGSSSNTSAVLEFTMPNNDVNITAHYTAVSYSWWYMGSNINSITRDLMFDDDHSLSSTLKIAYTISGTTNYIEGAALIHSSNLSYAGAENIANAAYERDTTGYSYINFGYPDGSTGDAGNTYLRYNYTSNNYIDLNINIEPLVEQQTLTIEVGDYASPQSFKYANHWVLNPQSHIKVPQYTETILIENCDNWSSNDSNIAIVDQSGRITGVSVGTTYISCEYEYNNQTLECNVIVNIIAPAGTVNVNLVDYPGQESWQKGENHNYTVSYTFGGAPTDITNYCDMEAYFAINGVRGNKCTPFEISFDSLNRGWFRIENHIRNLGNNEEIVLVTTYNGVTGQSIGFEYESQSGNNVTITLNVTNNTLVEPTINATDGTTDYAFILNSESESGEGEAEVETTDLVYTAEVPTDVELSVVFDFGESSVNMVVTDSESASVIVANNSFEVGILSDDAAYNVVINENESEGETPIESPEENETPVEPTPDPEEETETPVEPTPDPEEETETPVEPTPEPEPSPEEETSSEESPEEP